MNTIVSFGPPRATSGVRSALAMKSLGLAVAAGLLGSAAPAQAVIYEFTVSGDYAAVFRIDSSPPVTVLDPAVFLVEDDAGTYAGVAGKRNVSFYTPAASGGMAISTPDPFVSEMSVFGAQVFAGPIGAPTFLPGSYDFTGFVGAADGQSVRLVISAVPEPGTWLMLVAGIGALGAAARRRM